MIKFLVPDYYGTAYIGVSDISGAFVFKGAPEDLAARVQNLINTDVPPVNEFLLMETGDFLLLESGDKIVLQ